MKFHIYSMCTVAVLSWCSSVLSAPLTTTYYSEQHPKAGNVQDNLLIQDLEIINVQIKIMARVHSAEHDLEMLQILKAVFGDGVNLEEVKSMVNILSDVKAVVPIANVTTSLMGCEDTNPNENLVQAVWDHNSEPGRASAVQITDALFQQFPDAQSMDILSYATMVLTGMGTGEYWKLDSSHQKLVPVPSEEFWGLDDSERSRFVVGNVSQDYLAVYAWAQPDLLHKNAATWGVFGYVLFFGRFPEKLSVLNQKLPITFFKDYRMI